MKAEAAAAGSRRSTRSA